MLKLTNPDLIASVITLLEEQKVTVTPEELKALPLEDLTEEEAKMLSFSLYRPASDQMVKKVVINQNKKLYCFITDGKIDFAWLIFHSKEKTKGKRKAK